MSDFWKIVLSAIGVCGLAVGIYFVRLFMDGRRLRRRMRDRIEWTQEERLRAQASRDMPLVEDNTQAYPPGVGPGGMR